MPSVFISAGEASGDLHGSQLIKELMSQTPGINITFLGGDEMMKAAGASPVLHIKDMAFMGFTEVLKHLGKIFSNLKLAKKALRESRPNAVVLIDYPGFNMKLARYAHKLNIPVFYYIAPKVWAWKEWRVKSLRRYVTRILSILPFEPQWFKERGVEAIYVGNPTVEEIQTRLKPQPRRNILALIPGSRVAEIRSNLKVMAEVAKRHPELKPIVAQAPAIDPQIYQEICDFEIFPGTAMELMQISCAALVTSGTATLECALTGTPQVACYRSNGLKIAHDIFKHVLKIPFVTLPNLIAGKKVIPEMLVHHCNPDEVDAQLAPLLDSSPQRDIQLAGLQEVKEKLDVEKNASAKAASLILAGIK